MLSVLVATGRLSLSAKYFLPLNLASLVFTLADFLDYGIKCLVWLAGKGQLEYQICRTNRMLQKLGACPETKAKKRTALFKKCCKCEVSANKRLEKLNARTQQLDVNSPLASWIYLSSPISLAVLLVFSDKLPLMLSDSLIAATTLLPLGFLFLNMFFEHLMHETDERFLNEAVVSLYSIEHQKKALEEQLCVSATGKELESK